MMVKLFAVIGVMLLAEAGPASAQTPPTAVTPTSIRAALVGNWQGKLEYRDYQADRWFGIPVKVSIEMMRDGLTLIRHADFDDGPKTGIVTITSIALFDPATSREQSASFRKGRESEVTTATLKLTRTERSIAGRLRKQATAPMMIAPPASAKRRRATARRWSPSRKSISSTIPAKLG